MLTRDQPAPRRAVLREQRLSRLRRARLGVPRGHRRRGALCGHGPLRRRPDPHGVVRAGAARPAAQLLRPGRAAAAGSDGRRAAVLPCWRRPRWSLPLVLLASAAAVIASQALISAVFSLTRQAVQLGYSPRVEIRHTSHTTIGQIYIPTRQLGADAGDHRARAAVPVSSALAAAYGIAVTAHDGHHDGAGLRRGPPRWGWSRWTTGGITAVFLIIDTAFFGANALKILHGGWVPLVMAAFVFLLMSTWKTGRQILGARLRERRTRSTSSSRSCRARIPIACPARRSS